VESGVQLLACNLATDAKKRESVMHFDAHYLELFMSSMLPAFLAIPQRNAERLWLSHMGW
jgi:hypothetical protein